MRAGDYLFVQFGHNDMKEKGADIGPYTSYKTNLKKYMEEARGKGGIPVLVTFHESQEMDSTGHMVNTLKEYPDAVRQLAKEENVPLIDLNAMSKTFYEAIGAKNLSKAFVDGTHHNMYGSYELAKCVVQGICRTTSLIWRNSSWMTSRRTTRNIRMRLVASQFPPARRFQRRRRRGVERSRLRRSNKTKTIVTTDKSQIHTDEMQGRISRKAQRARRSQGEHFSASLAGRIRAGWRLCVRFFVVFICG